MHGSKQELISTEMASMQAEIGAKQLALQVTGAEEPALQVKKSPRAEEPAFQRNESW